MRGGSAAVVLVTATLVVSGCGGASGAGSTQTTTSNASSTETGPPARLIPAGERLSPAKLIAQANAVCVRHNVASINTKSHISNEADLRRFTREEVPIEQAALTELSKLTPPASLEPDWNQYIAYRRMVLATWQKIAEEGTPKGSGNLTRAGAAREAMIAAAGRMGLKKCQQLT